MKPSRDRTFSREEAKRIHAEVAREKLTDSLAAWTALGDRSRYIFLHPWEFWPHQVVRRTETPRVLRESLRADVASFSVESPEGAIPLQEVVTASTVDGMIIVHRGEVVYESYPRMRPTDKHLLFSVSKVLVGAVVARLEQAGLVDVRSSVSTYFEPLAGTEWDAVRVVDLLDMCSGMDCPIVFGSADTCFERMYAAYGFPLPKAWETAHGDVLPFFASIGRARPAGESFEYIDLNTLALTLLVETVTGRRFAEVLESEIWSKIGPESDATIMSAAFGRAVTPMGISMTLRDLARFGLAFLPDHGAEHPVLFESNTLRKIVDGARPELFAASSNANMFGTDERLRNSYHWDHVTDEGDLFKQGLAGQGLYVSPSRRLVIAFFGTPRPDASGHRLSVVARRLATSPLFASA